MKIFSRCALIVLVFFVSLVPLAAQQKPMRVVATTTWTAALAAAAGVTDVITLAPSDLRHPAEYEMKPSDVFSLRGADLIIASGFEVMTKKLAEAAGSQKIRVLQIGADYSLETMKRSILAVAAVTGTETEARANIAALEGFFASWKAELGAKGLFGAAVLGHVFQLPLLKELGFTVRGAFGPGPLEAAQIAKLSMQKADFIIDNWHNEVGEPLRETLPTTRYVSLINFPGPDGTVTLLDVLADNKKRLADVAAR